MCACLSFRLSALTSHLYQSLARSHTKNPPQKHILVLSNHFHAAWCLIYLKSIPPHTLVVCWWICLWSVFLGNLPDIRRVWQSRRLRPMYDLAEINTQLLSWLQRLMFKELFWKGKICVGCPLGRFGLSRLIPNTRAVVLKPFSIMFPLWTVFFKPCTP